MRPLLKPLIPLYAFGVGWKNSRFDNGKLPIRKLAKPVLSIGSLSAGGAGKTPVVLALLDLLKQHGITADVLSRGYGRTLTDALKVDPQGRASDYGDEAMMLARLGNNVFVAPQRYDAGILAEREPEPAQLHILDDGMQHRQLHRSADVALLTFEDANDWLLPAGNLREPLENLRRAQVIVLREDEARRLAPAIHRYAPIARQWIIRRELQLDGPTPERAYAFCGIARPDGFFTMLRKQGVPLVIQRAFRDHHAYTPGDIAAITQRAQQVLCDAIITTGKDAVKLPRSIPNLRIAKLQTTFLNPEEVWQDLQQLLNL